MLPPVEDAIGPDGRRPAPHDGRPRPNIERGWAERPEEETNKDARNECTAVRDALAGLQQCEPPVHGLAGARRGLIGSTRELPP
eukprot:CAMPEP_0176284462 /NCGR_PEP_ID=MMETSP0121_2-20121125/51861_1 /TAXON_ID=160619 /ORGANISM="Kryptoperidinium foliaceum, Strain CCMP 1326" /LENGTH=83 /DNA_ID=CAMNT_0017624905 /DNA_START=91 /DNA_END=339 /DNA_ORIENTATION=+